MYTTLDKAIVALVMAAIGIVNVVTPWHFGLDQSTVTTIVAALTPILVWAWPNAPKDVK